MCFCRLYTVYQTETTHYCTAHDGHMMVGRKWVGHFSLSVLCTWTVNLPPKGVLILFQTEAQNFLNRRADHEKIENCQLMEQHLCLLHCFSCCVEFFPFIPMQAFSMRWCWQGCHCQAGLTGWRSGLTCQAGPLA